MIEVSRRFRHSTGLVALWTLTALSCGTGATQVASTTGGGTGSIDPIDQVPATCGSLDAAAVARIAPANLERVLRRASRSVDFTDTSFILPKALTGRSSSSPWDHKSVDTGIDDAVKSFREHLFVDANLESQAADVVTYRLRADTMCSSSTSTALPGVDGGAPVVQVSSCEKFFNEHELRLEVRRVSCDAGDNLRIDLVADPERHKVLAADWFENRIAASIDIGEAVGRLQAYGSFDSSIVFEQARGRLAFGIDTTPAGAVTMRMAVPVAIDVEGHDTTTRAGLVVARADDAFVLSADPATKHLHASVGVGSVDTTMPLKDFVSAFFARTATSAGMDTVKISLPGLQGDLDYDGNTDSLAIRHLGMGNDTTRVTRGDNTLLAIDFNADAGRHVDLNVTADAQHQLVLDLTPKMQLDLVYSMASVNPLVTNLEAFALDDTVTIQVDGPPALKLMETAVGTSTLMQGGTGWLLAMTTGQLSMTSRAIPTESVHVGAGQCLFRSMAPFTGQHEMLREVSSRACP